MQTEEEKLIEERKWMQVNPGSVEDPAAYELAYELRQNAPKRFNAIYGESMRNIVRRSKGKEAVGIFAHETSLYPERGLKSDIAFDLKAAKDFRISLGQVRAILTGVRVVMPNNVYALIKGRSGISSRWGIDVLAGVIDPGYRGEIAVTLLRPNIRMSIAMQRKHDGSINHNVREISDTLKFKKGDRIAQLIFFPHTNHYYPIFEIDKIEKSERGDKGHGSTGIPGKEDTKANWKE